MTTLEIIDLEITLPHDTTVTVAPPEATREVRVLEGTSAAILASAIEDAAVRAGFEVRRTSSRDALLERGDQAIYLFQRTDMGLVVRIEDPRAFPVARVTDGGVHIHDLYFAIAADKIVPGRERHVEGSPEWSADWVVFGPSAAELSRRLHAAFVAIGLRGNGVWPPPSGSDRWKVEAYSPERLLQAEVFARPDYCELKIHLVTS